MTTNIEKAQAKRAETKLNRLEDAEWMARGGESIYGAAARLDMTPWGLYQLLHREGRDDLVVLLGFPEKETA